MQPAFSPAFPPPPLSCTHVKNPVICPDGSWALASQRGRAHPEGQEQGWGWPWTVAQPSCIRIRPWAPSPSGPTGPGLCPAPPGVATHLPWPVLDSGCRQRQGWFFGGILAPTELCNSAEVPLSKHRLQTCKQHREGGRRLSQIKNEEN